MYLIIGGDSLIGSTLSSYWHQKNILYHASTRHKEKASDSHPMIDIREIQSFQNLNNYKSAVICAAVTDMAACEIKPIESRAVNVTATIELIKKLINKKTHIVFLSTNQVFDGERPYQKPYAPHNPINEYGRQKAEVEAFLKAHEHVGLYEVVEVLLVHTEGVEKGLVIGLNIEEGLFVFGRFLRKGGQG